MSPEYKSPALGVRSSEKFLRVEDRIYVGDNQNPFHRDIAEEHDLMDKIEELRKTDPTQVDAGFFIADRDGEIILCDYSAGLELPVEGYQEHSRAITVGEFRKQSPDHTVSSDIDCSYSTSNDR